jgi:Fe-S-cluster-containing dehydrogenase component
MEKRILKTNAQGKAWQWEENGFVVTRSHARTAPACVHRCMAGCMEFGDLVELAGKITMPRQVLFAVG